MGEYGTLNDGSGLKIGTCEINYYLRLEDKHRVTPEPGSSFGWFWRIPFPDEDNIKPGGYRPHNRGALLNSEFTIKDNPGRVQTSHECGYLLNIPCYHGNKLPENTGGIKMHWNGAYGQWFELIYIKAKPDPMPAVRCRACDNLWSFDNWEEVLPYVIDEELKLRLEELYAKK